MRKGEIGMGEDLIVPKKSERRHQSRWRLFYLNASTIGMAAIMPKNIDRMRTMDSITILGMGKS